MKQEGLGELEFKGHICPTCGRDDFLSKRGMYSHHSQSHGGPISPCVFYTGSGGYHIAKSQYQGEQEYVMIHRLVAVAEYGYDEVVDKDIHHKNQIRWDNRPENLEVINRDEHMRNHWKVEPLVDRIENASKIEVKAALRQAGYERAGDEIDNE